MDALPIAGDQAAGLFEIRPGAGVDELKPKASVARGPGLLRAAWLFRRNTLGQRQQFRCDLNGLCLHYTGLHAGIYRNAQRKKLGHVLFRNVPDASRNHT